MVSFTSVVVFTLIAAALCQHNDNRDNRGGGRNDNNNRGGGNRGRGGKNRQKYDPNLTQELNDCHDEIDTYSDCMKGGADLKKAKFDTEKSDNFKKQIANCFTLHGCEYKEVEQIKPTGDPITIAKLAKFEQFWGQLDSTRQNCFTKEVRDEFVDKLNRCVNKSAPGYSLPVATDAVQNAQDDNAKARKVGHDRHSVRASLQNCKAGSKDVKKCISDLRKPLDKPGCDLQTTCSKAMSSKCSTALGQLKTIACKCVDKQHKSIGGKLSAVKRKNNRKNKIPASTDENEDLVNNIQKNCNIQFSSDVQNAADNIPDSLQEQAAEYVDAQAEREVGFCNVCGKERNN